MPVKNINRDRRPTLKVMCPPSIAFMSEGCSTTMTFLFVVILPVFINQTLFITFFSNVLGEFSILGHIIAQSTFSQTCFVKKKLRDHSSYGKGITTKSV